MNIVLDTNVFLVSLASKSKYHHIYQCLLNGVFDLYVSNEIVTEYEEVISQRLGCNPTGLKLQELLNLRNVHKVEPFYLWQLIDADPDDNKFVDCAVLARADYLVTNDKHYNLLASIPFPPVVTMKAEEFLELLEKHRF